MMLSHLQGPSVVFRIAGIAILWLSFISFLHAYLNSDRGSSKKVLMGYMPVITNLAAPLVDHVTRDREPYFEALKFGSFAEMAEAFRSKHIQVAFIIAPVAIALYQQGVSLRVVYIGNRHESTFIVRSGLSAGGSRDLSGKTVAVPIRYSGHLLALKRYFRQQGLDETSVSIVEVPPPDMPVALATGSIDGYFVGEPFASTSLKSGTGTRLLNVEEIWPKFICNLMIVQEDLIMSRPEWVQQLVSAAVRSGLWAQGHIDEVVQITSKYWGQDPEVIRFAFSEPRGRIRFDMYLPVEEELREIGCEMQQAGFIQGELKLSGIVDDRFARRVDVSDVPSMRNIIPHP